jgi:hypothetical protein
MFTVPAQLHLHAIINMVTAGGGWGNFDPYMLESTIQLERYVASTDNTPPVLLLA